MTILKDIYMENTISSFKMSLCFSQNYLQMHRKFQDRDNSYLQMATTIWET